MINTSTSRVAVGLAAGALMVGGYSGTAGANEAPNTGCTNGNDNKESGFQLLVVADLLAVGYRLPGILDNPENGGNGDGLVCGLPMGNQLTPNGNQLYLFIDNQFFPGP